MMKEASQRKQVIVTTHNPEVVKNAHVADVHLGVEGHGRLFDNHQAIAAGRCESLLQNEIGLEELFVQNLLHSSKWLTRRSTSS